MYENRTTEGGESKISKAYLGTEPPKAVSLKFAEPPKVVSLKFAEPPKVVSIKLKNYFPKNRTTEGGETKVCRTTEGGESKISKSYLRTEPPKVLSLKLVKLT